MQKLQEISRQFMDGELTGEEYYLKLGEVLSDMVCDDKADERMTEVARRLQKQ